MENDDKVILLDENGKEFEATIINIVEIDGNEYLLYSVDANEEDANLFVNKIIRDEKGEEDIVPIDNDEERNMVFDSINEFVSDMN